MISTSLEIGTQRPLKNTKKKNIIYVFERFGELHFLPTFKAWSVRLCIAIARLCIAIAKSDTSRLFGYRGERPLKNTKKKKQNCFADIPWKHAALKCLAVTLTHTLMLTSQDA